MAANTERLVLNADELAAALGICRPAAYDLMHRRGFPSIKLPHGALWCRGPRWRSGSCSRRREKRRMDDTRGRVRGEAGTIRGR